MLFRLSSSFLYENEMAGCTLIINNLGFLAKKKRLHLHAIQELASY